MYVREIETMLFSLQFRWDPAILMLVTGFPISCSRCWDSTLKYYQSFLLFCGRLSVGGIVTKLRPGCERNRGSVHCMGSR